MKSAIAQAGQPDLPVYDNAQAWVGPQLAARRDWIHAFGGDERAEISAAVAAAEQSGLDLLDLRRPHFPLPGLGAKLRQLRREALHGRGFFMLRGLPLDEKNPRRSVLAFWGLGLHLGDQPASQNGKGHVLGHVTNLGLDYADPEVRGYQTNARLAYHTDYSDLVCLLCLRGAKAGGLSSIVSSTTLWNELVRTRPALARVLMSPLYYTRWGEIPAGRRRHAEVPVFAHCGGRLIGTYVRSAIRKAQEFLPEVPRLSAEQLEAMDFLDALAADPRLHLDMDFRPGDVQVVCNHSVFHSRTAYEDWPDPARRRHLLRLWLACNDGPDLPAYFTGDYQGRTAGGRPDGIQVPGVPLQAPLQAG